MADQNSSIRHVYIIYFLFLGIIYSLFAASYFYHQTLEKEKEIKNIQYHHELEKEELQEQIKETLNKKQEKLNKVSAEIECLTKNIYYEASHEPIIGKRAVAFVTMNRVKDKHFPKTVCGVVYQKHKKTCQFSWVCGVKKGYNHKEYTEAKRVAYNIYNNYKKLKDVTYGSLFFHGSYIMPYWSYEKEYVAQIGNHVFYRR